jgi:aryl-alcohol dehydrogenase-like predicted oxidoreductase
VITRRQLGKSGIFVTPLCFGGNVFGWTVDEPTSFALLDRFVEAGFDFIDTADVYSRWVPGHAGGESEAIIGRWLKVRGGREKLVIATKVGSEMGEGKKGLSRAYIRSAVEASLRRLQTDYIDLYQSHRDDETVPMEETLGAYQELIDEGKVRIIGASNFTAERLKQALETSAKLGLPRYETLQPLYNLYNREGFEAALMPLCEAEQVSVIPYYALAAGFLTGKYRSEADFSKSARGGGMGKYLNDRGRRILGALDTVASAFGATPAEVAVAWLSHRPAIAAPIASATSIAQLESLIASTWLDLDDKAAELDAASA